ncbi:Tyrosine-protein phosphatase [Cytospora mali]|uniref:Tyrosine-protein phosphatase n=1 Tax=Cytospora mali TaxID=578113 RepID=A0A194VBF4_CYTMA|nr:Tyrosine-protein phosphatase [Valsa mali var. pyri (nom. inval.)]
MAAQLRLLAETDVRNPIPPSELLTALQTPPFVFVPGTFNTRDLGLLTSSRYHPRIRPGFLFRTGGLDSLHRSTDGQAVIRDVLHIRRIFDLRSQDEHAKSPDPAIKGVENVWLGDEGGGVKEHNPMMDLGPFMDGDGEEGYVGMYMDVLDKYRGSFAEVLRSVRDRPGEAVLFHCTAGRDRTGVLAGVLETLAGYDDETVRMDFLLSRIGIEVAREQLLEFARKYSEGMGGHGSSVTGFDGVPGFYNLVSLKVTCWDAFVEAVGKKYGGFEGYVTRVLGFSDEDLVKIKRNLVEEP